MGKWQCEVRQGAWGMVVRREQGAVGNVSRGEWGKLDNSSQPGVFEKRGDHRKRSQITKCGK